MTKDVKRERLKWKDGEEKERKKRRKGREGRKESECTIAKPVAIGSLFW